MIKSKYPDIDHIDTELPQWQKDLIDSRLEAFKRNSERILPIDSFFDGLDD